jgi:ADP-ribosylglycohydrolase
MLGAIAGDIIGSVYEHDPIRTKRFPLFRPDSRFTDDTVCTAAIAESLIRDTPFDASLRALVRRHPGRGYGELFRAWVLSDGMPAYGSWGNGAAMRVAPVGFAAASLEQGLELAEASAIVSHNHPDAVAGAKAVTLAAVLARAGAGAEAIRAAVAARFGYELHETVNAIRARYSFDVSAAGTVPPALICALDASDYEDAIRNAVSLGGDSDTLACIAGAVAEALFGVPAPIAEAARHYLTPDLVEILSRFYDRFPPHRSPVGLATTL